LLREAKATVHVGKSSSCASACSFIFAGGVVRSVFGKIGIHRPALAALPQHTDMKSIKQFADASATELRAYVAEMNVSERLIGDMFVVPPEKIRWLSRKELDEYGLGAIDPVFAETLTLDGAKAYGIVPGEYRIRAQRADAICGRPVEAETTSTRQLYDCRRSVLSGDTQ
jgi:hypothetical protein